MSERVQPRRWGQSRLGWRELRWAVAKPDTACFSSEVTAADKRHWAYWPLDQVYFGLSALCLAQLDNTRREHKRWKIQLTVHTNSDLLEVNWQYTEVNWLRCASTPRAGWLKTGGKIQLVSKRVSEWAWVSPSTLALRLLSALNPERMDALLMRSREHRICSPRRLSKKGEGDTREGRGSRYPQRHL